MLRFFIFGYALLCSQLLVHAQACLPHPGPAIFTEDFGSGPNPGPALPVGSTGFIYGNIGPSGYVVSNTSGINGREWHDGEDHTPDDTDGYMLLFNAGEGPQLFYQHTFTDLCPNTEYIFTCHLANVTVPTACIGNSVRPHVQFTVINPDDESIVLRTSNGRVFIRSRLTFETNSYRFRTGPDQYTARIELTNLANGGCGNDLALDDISLHLCNPQLTQEYDLCDLPGGQLSVGPNTYTEAGTYLNQLPIAGTCNDTLLTTIISGEKRRLPTLRYTICQGDTIELAGRPYANSINFTDTLVQNDPACPLFQPYELRVQTPFVHIQDTTLCHGDRLQVGNRWYSQAGNYADTLTTRAGCDSIVLSTIATGTIDLFLRPERVEVEVGERIPLDIEVSGSTDYILTWQPDTGLSCIDCPNPVLSPETAGTYQLVATDIPSGCTVSASLQVSILSCENVFIPNAFSPNRDGINDFLVLFPDDCFTRLVSWEIFDRWGSLVYQVQDQALPNSQIAWDGFTPEKAAAPGMYTYHLVLERDNGTLKIKQGEANLIK